MKSCTSMSLAVPSPASPSRSDVMAVCLFPRCDIFSSGPPSVQFTPERMCNLLQATIQPFEKPISDLFLPNRFSADDDIVYKL